MFELPQVEIFDYYSQVLNTLFMTFFYAPALPLGIVFAIINVYGIKIATKYIFLRRAPMPRVIGL